jgi:GNAT superfamily N-acetyltransferase
MANDTREPESIAKLDTSSRVAMHQDSPSSKDQQRPTPARPSIHISIPLVSIADDEAIVTRLANIINAAYKISEQGIFTSAYVRVSADDVRRLLRGSELALAWLKPETPASGTEMASPSPQFSPEALIGCVRVEDRGPDTGAFGLLACDTAFQGTGAGTALVRFAEEQCRARGKTVMQCELLVPYEFVQPVKARILAWYNRLGYEVIRNGDFDAEYPAIAANMAAKTYFRVLEKELK